jgi:aspartyl protease family protein
MIGWAVRRLTIWGALGLLIYALVGHRLSPPNPTAPAPAVSPSGSEQTRDAADRQMVNSLVYRPDGRGHVVVDAVVNGSPVRFLIDTGATFVVLTMADAAAAGFTRGDLVFNVRTSTANGVGRAAAVQLREVRVGQFSVYDVPAFVGDNLAVSLLGQSFLTRLDSYEMRDGVLTLNWN